MGGGGGSGPCDQNPHSCIAQGQKNSGILHQVAQNEQRTVCWKHCQILDPSLGNTPDAYAQMQLKLFCISQKILWPFAARNKQERTLRTQICTSAHFCDWSWLWVMSLINEWYIHFVLPLLNSCALHIQPMT